MVGSSNVMNTRKIALFTIENTGFHYPQIVFSFLRGKTVLRSTSAFMHATESSGVAVLEQN